REARVVRVSNPVRDRRAFDQTKDHLRRLSPAPTTEQATKKTGRTTRGGGGGGENGPPAGHVPPPSGAYQAYNEGNLFRLSVPSNWREPQDTNRVTFPPEGAYGNTHGARAFTNSIALC